jgi:hypothetical protein
MRGNNHRQTKLGSQRRQNLVRSSNFLYALLITAIIILAQLFIVHYYIGNTTRRQRFFSSGNANRESNLLSKSHWFCHSFLHLNRIAELANKFQVELIIVDPDLLELLDDKNDSSTTDDGQPASVGRGSKTKQEASHKTMIHLAAINETSGGQPNLKLFYNALKEHYHVIKYHDASETMAAEVYNQQPHQLDDVHFDAIQDSNRLEHEQHEALNAVDFEISKIYTEFIAHLFIVNVSGPIGSVPAEWISPKNCLRSETGHNSEPFIVLHLFVLYNYEFQPGEKWIQSSLLLDEVERHKLLAYGVHLVDFKVSLDHYYVHDKRKTSNLFEASSLASPLKPERPMNRLKILEPENLLSYANNTYLHCKQSAFNISALVNENRQISRYLKTLDAAKPLKSSRYRTILLDQLSIALQFMNVFSKSYGNFSFWITGSTLLAYHKFCQLIAITRSGKSIDSFESTTEDDQLLLSMDDYEEQVLNENNMLDFELGLFESELNSTMLHDLSKANMIGVTMISDWREPEKNGLVSFHVKDCPNLLFNLHFYRLKRDSYRQYYVTNDNMIYNHKIRRRKSLKDQKPAGQVSPAVMAESSGVNGYHMFTARNLELCWTRLDLLEPFRVPCDAHDHLLRIYVR